MLTCTPGGAERDLVAGDEEYTQRSGSNREAKYNQVPGLWSAALLLSLGNFVCVSVFLFCFFPPEARTCSPGSRT